MKYSDKQKADGRKRLKAMMPEAIAWAETAMREPEMEMKVLSGRGQAMTDYVRLDNLKALILYRTARGWYADLVLKQTPVGVTDVMGTPTDMPLPSREEAEEQGKMILRAACLQAKMNGPAMPDNTRNAPRYFSLYGTELKLDGEYLDMLSAVPAMLGQTPAEAREYALERMDEVSAQHGFTEDNVKQRLAAMDQDTFMEVYCLAFMLATVSIVRYPVREPDPMLGENGMPPQTHTGSRTVS